jgi:hypothetical protein
MKRQHADQNDACPLDELRPELRRVVERIAREMPPEGLMQRVLDGVRRQEPLDPDMRPRPLEHRQGRRTIPWNFATTSAVGVAVCTLMLLAVSLSHLRVPNPEAVPQMPMAVHQDLPTAWAYHKAITESPEAVDALLARHARQMLRPEPNSFPAHAYPYALQPVL